MNLKWDDSLYIIDIEFNIAILQSSIYLIINFIINQ